METMPFLKKSGGVDNISETPNPEIEGFLENREMYNLPGFPDITEKDIRRYTESNKELYKKLPDIIQENFKSGNREDCVRAATMIPYAPESQQKPLQEQIRKIMKGFEEMKIDHGHVHIHQGNFVLLFPRNEDGTADLSHPPRVYVIDFDMARPKQELGE